MTTHICRTGVTWGACGWLAPHDRMLQVPPPETVVIPPLRVWTFIPVTGQILSRQVLMDNESSPSKATPDRPDPKVSAASSGSTNAVNTGKIAPSTETPQGKVIVGAGGTADDGDDDGDNEDGEDQEDGDEANDNLEEELKKLEALTQVGDKSKKKRGKSTGGQGKPPQKKPKAS